MSRFVGRLISMTSKTAVSEPNEFVEIARRQSDGS